MVDSGWPALFASVSPSVLLLLLLFSPTTILLTKSTSPNSPCPSVVWPLMLELSGFWLPDFVLPS